MFSCEFCDIFKNIFLYRTLLMAASGFILFISKQCLCKHFSRYPASICFFKVSSENPKTLCEIIIDIALASLLFILNSFYTLFWGFHCYFERSRLQLGIVLHEKLLTPRKSNRSLKLVIQVKCFTEKINVNAVTDLFNFQRNLFSDLVQGLSLF